MPEEAELRDRTQRAMPPARRCIMRGRDWSGRMSGETIEYRDRHGRLTLPLPQLPGAHQGGQRRARGGDAAAQDRVTVSPEAMAEGIRSARWPAGCSCSATAR